MTKFLRKSRKGFRTGPPSPDPEPVDFTAAQLRHRMAHGWPAWVEPPRGRAWRHPSPIPLGRELTDTPIVPRHDPLAGWRCQRPPALARGDVRRGPTPKLPAVFGPYCIDVAEVWAVGTSAEAAIAAAEIYSPGAAASQLACE